MREQSHRRATLLATTVLLALATSPVFGHHVALGHLLDGVDHVGVLCLTALHLLLAPAHYGFHVLLLAGLGYAVGERWRAWSLTRRALGPLDAFRAEPGDPF